MSRTQRCRGSRVLAMPDANGWIPSLRPWYGCVVATIEEESVIENPKVFKRPERADKAVQATVLAELANNPPAPVEEGEEGEEAEAQLKRFDTGTTDHVFTVMVDDGVECCAEVADPDSDRVWVLAVWPNPPAIEGLADVETSYCLVIGSKKEARERLAGISDEPAFVAKKDQTDPRNRGVGAYQASVSRRGTRVQQKQG